MDSARLQDDLSLGYDVEFDRFLGDVPSLPGLEQHVSAMAAFDLALMNWEFDPSRGSSENRTEAVSRIRACCLAKVSGQCDKVAYELCLSDLGLTTLPSELGSLTALRRLNVSINKIRSIPASIGQLQDLRELNVSCNQLVELPASLGLLRNLEELKVCLNDLTEISSFIRFMLNLKNLYFSVNRLTEIPSWIDDLNQLEILDCGFNRITRLPNELGKLNCLSELDVGNNPLQFIPSSLLGLENLRVFNVIGLPEKYASVLPSRRITPFYHAQGNAAHIMAAFNAKGLLES